MGPWGPCSGVRGPCSEGETLGSQKFTQIEEETMGPKDLIDFSCFIDFWNRFLVGFLKDYVGARSTELRGPLRAL